MIQNPKTIESCTQRSLDLPHSSILNSLPTKGYCYQFLFSIVVLFCQYLYPLLRPPHHIAYFLYKILCILFCTLPFFITMIQSVASSRSFHREIFLSFLWLHGIPLCGSSFNKAPIAKHCSHSFAFVSSATEKIPHMYGLSFQSGYC